jgi:hypothetical protein
MIASTTTTTTTTAAAIIFTAASTAFLKFFLSRDTSYPSAGPEIAPVLPVASTTTIPLISLAIPVSAGILVLTAAISTRVPLPLLVIILLAITTSSSIIIVVGVIVLPPIATASVRTLKPPLVPTSVLRLAVAIAWRLRCRFLSFRFGWNFAHEKRSIAILEKVTFGY